MKSVLGRGLQSLIPKKQPKISSLAKTKIKLKDLAKLKKESIFNIETDKIKPNPNQPRKDMSEAQLEELAASIKEYGILQPLIVTKVERETKRGRDVEYELVAGERRWRAAQLAKLPRVPVIIKDNSKRIKFEMALVENVQRENLNPIEKAMAYRRLVDEFGLSQEEISRKVGKNKPTISNSMRLLKLPPVIQEALVEGKINERMGRAILTAPQEQRTSFFRQMIKNNWNALQTEIKASNLQKIKTHRRPMGPKNVLFRSLEHKIQLAMGQEVSITKRGDIGNLKIQFSNQKELDKIVNYLLKF